jgi:hypothetical protein
MSVDEQLVNSICSKEQAVCKRESSVHEPSTRVSWIVLTFSEGSPLSLPLFLRSTRVASEVEPLASCPWSSAGKERRAVSARAAALGKRS